MNLIVIATIKKFVPEEVTIGFRIYDKDTKQRMDASLDSVTQQLKSGKVTVDGLEVVNGEVRGSNGSLDRYPSIFNGMLLSKCPLIITKVYPDNIYGVVNYLGKEDKMSADALVRYYSTEGIANAKVVTRDGKQFISRINGEFEKDRMFRDLEAGEKAKSKMVLMGVEYYALDENNLAYCDCDKDKQAEDLVLALGCLGIRKNGFNGNIAKTVVMPKTCTKLQASGMANMTNLAKVVIPEGVEEIPLNFFANCVNLTEVSLPNSCTKVGNGAFKGCRKLKIVYTGPIRPETSLNSFERGVKLVPRR